MVGLFSFLGIACAMGETDVKKDTSPPADPLARHREIMVTTQIEARGVRDAEVLRAMRSVPRHRFVPPDLRDQAHSDRPLPIGQRHSV